MNTFKLTLEYNGTRYRGWQAQKNADAVANHLERAARQVFKDFQELYGAGRTDAGVHALGQVAHVKARGLMKAKANIKLALNDLLPGDIAVLDAREVDGNFHARRFAKERVYLYQILRRRAAFAPELSWWVKDRLHVEKMRAAAAALVGRHDFSSFCDKDPEKEAGTGVDLRSVELREDGALLLVRFRADHFLWKQVRRMVGFLAEVGRGRMKVEDAARLLKSPSRELAPFTAPPGGLFLEKVCYENDRFNQAPRAVTFLN